MVKVFSLISINPNRVGETMDTRAIQKWPKFAGFTGLEDKYIGRCFMWASGLKRGESLTQGMGPKCAGDYNTEVINASVQPDYETYNQKIEAAGLRGCINNKAEPLDKLHALVHFLSKGLENDQAFLVCDAICALGFSSIGETARKKLKIMPPPPPEVALKAVNHDKHGKQIQLEPLNGWDTSKKIIALKEKIKAEIPCWHYDGNIRRWMADGTPRGARAWISFVNEHWPKLNIIDEKILKLADEPDEEPERKPTEEKALIKKVPGGFHIYTPKFDQSVYKAITEAPKDERKWIPKEENPVSADGRPGAWFIQAKDVPRVIAAVLKVWPKTEDKYSVDCAQETKEENQRLQIAMKLSNAIDCDPSEIIELPGGPTYPYQSVGIRFAMLNRRVLIADAMGSGKTIMALGYIYMIKGYKALIVCPASVKLNWARQTRRWLGNDISISVINGNKVQPVNDDGMRLRSNGIMSEIKEAADVMIINYDILKRHAKDLKRLGFTTVVFDESHYIKESRSARSQAALDIARGIENRLLMTGTPILNRPKELFHQLHMINPQRWPDFFKYALEFCDAHQKHIGRGKMVWDFTGHSNIEKLNKMITGVEMIRRTKDQLLPDLPNKRRWNTLLDVKREIRANYDAAERDFLGWISRHKDGDKVAKAARAEAITRLTTLRHLVVQTKTEATVNYVNEWLDSHEKDEACIVWGHHVDTMTAVASRLSEGHAVVKIFGGVSTNQR